MLSLSPFSPVQYYEQVQPALRVGRTSERTFTPPEQGGAASQQKTQVDRSKDQQEQGLRGFGTSATLLSSLLLAELGRQASASPGKGAADTPETSERAVGDKRRKPAEAEREDTQDAVSESTEETAATVGLARTQTSEAGSDASGGDGSGSRSGTETSGASIAANDSDDPTEGDRSVFLLRLQRAKTTYAQGQMASGEYSFARSAEVFQMVA